MAGQFKARTIREEKKFTEEKRNLKHSAKRIDEVLAGVTWTLCRKPESFLNIPGTKLYLAKTDEFPNNPGFYIWFTFDSETVFLHSIEEAPAEG
jgi:hypothetical protein